MRPSRTEHDRRRGASPWRVVLPFALLAASPRSAAGLPPSREVVADAATAVAVARAILAPLYGEEVIARQEPFVAERRGADWFVRGTLRCGNAPRCVGGTAELTLAARDGRVLRVTHTQ